MTTLIIKVLAIANCSSFIAVSRFKKAAEQRPSAGGRELHHMQSLDERHVDSGSQQALVHLACSIDRSKHYPRSGPRVLLFFGCEFLKQLPLEFIRRLGGVTAVGCRNDRRIMLWHDYDPHEEPSPAASPEVHHPPAFVLSNSPPQRKSVVASVEWAVEPLVYRLREQGTPAAQPVQVVGRVEGEVPDRAMHRTRRP